MNTKSMKTIFVRTMYSMVILAVVLSAAGSVSAQEELNPHFTVYPVWEAVEAWDWPDGVTVTAIVSGKSDDCHTEGMSGYPEWDPWTTNVWMNFPEGCDVVTGDEVILSAEGVPPVSHTVLNLSVTEIDTDVDTVAGTADSGVTVYVWPHGFGEYEVQPTAGGDNVWLAVFPEEFNLEPGMGGRAEIRDGDGNATAVDWHAPKPRFTVYPIWNAVEAWDWPDGVTVAASVGGKSECYTEGMSGYPEWDPSTTNVWMNFPEGCDVIVDDVVTLTAEGAMPVSHTVLNISVTEVNADADTVAGTADPGVTVYVWPHGFGQYEMQPTAAGGVWLADFSGFGDVLQPGMDGRSEVRDEHGNSTAVDWHAPKPRFTVYPIWEAVEAWDWPAGTTVAASVDGKSECITDGVPGYPDGDPSTTNVWMNFPEGCDVIVDDVVTLTAEGVMPVSHTVRNLSVTEVNADADTVAGTADPGVTVYVWPHGFGEYEVQPTAVGGVWLADFSGFGDDVLQPGMDGRSEVRDDYGNSTAVDWHAPKPRFTVYPEWEAVEAWDWPEGVLVTASVVGNSECITEGTPGYPDWDPSTTNVWMNFSESCDVVAGDEVILSAAGVTPVSHIVQNLSVTKVDPGDDIVKGTADPRAEVHVWPHATGQEQMATANPKGKWNVDFNEDYDLMPGDGGRAEIRDETGNATAVDWYIPQPRFTIFPDAQWFDGIDWPDGVTVTITVKNKSECTFTRESWGGFFNGGFPEGCFVTAGDRVTFTDGTTTRKHTIRNLAITMIDKETNTVTGIADTGAVVHTWVWNSDGSTLDGSNLEVTAVDGMWQADFGALGINLEIGMGIQAEIRDENGNATSVDLNVPNTRIVASITEDWFFLVDFLPGATLDLSIYESQGGNLIWSDDGIKADVNGFAWIDSEGWDLEPGYYLVASDGNTPKDLEIEGFTFDVFDLANGHLEGTAPEPFGRTVWVGIGFENDVWSMEATTDGTGAWFADFDTPVPSNYQWVAAQIFDDDGDASELRPAQVVNLWVAAYTHDLQAGTLADGTYPYHFELEWSFPDPGTFSGQGGEFVISSGAPVYDGYVLLRGERELHGINYPEGLSCEEVYEINPNQPMRFLIGWLPDYGMTYPEAQTYFGNLTGRAVWGDEISAELTPHEIIPFSFDDLDSWFNYVCTFTE